MPEKDQKELFGEVEGRKSKDVSQKPASPDSPPTVSSRNPTTYDLRPTTPLASRMRPRGLGEVVGQDHILGEGCLLPKLVRTDRFGSLLFYGPPGTGKTSIARAIAEETGSRFVQINAVLSNTAELRDILRMARHYPDQRTILFIDEIHRFNKAQQDLLLPDVESGNIRLIGATTHNPGFYVNPPLLSRSHLFKLEPVHNDAVTGVLRRALEDDERGLGAMRVSAPDDVLDLIARMCDGDLRRALNALETIVLGLQSTDDGPQSTIDRKDVEAFARERHIRYDANEDEHYDTVSAYIKSMRGGDPDAALYWLAKMLHGGEDPRFIARRMVIFASEDVGLADPRALQLAVACKEAVDFVGLPECQLNLSHVTVFLATCPKSNSTTAAIGRAMRSIKENGLQPVPLWLRDAHTKLNKSLGHGKDYTYSHDVPDSVTGQTYMEKPEQFYFPKDSGLEARIKERVEQGRRS